MQFKARALNCGCKNRHLESKYHMILRLITVFLFIAASLASHSNEKLRFQADSMFQIQKYTEAFQIYEAIFEEDKYSESMLLKMAFIKDGLGNYVDALYYLDLYYQASADKSVVFKIEELSKENNLIGYTYNDGHFFKAVLNKYNGRLQLAIMSIVVFLAVYIYRKKAQGERPVTASVFQLLSLTALLLLSNDAYENQQGIIQQNSTLLRTGPSAGAEPVEMINKGHKVQVLDQTEVWTKISWNGDEVFLRNGKIRII